MDGVDTVYTRTNVNNRIREVAKSKGLISTQASRGTPAYLQGTLPWRKTPFESWFLAWQQVVSHGVSISSKTHKARWCAAVLSVAVALYAAS